MAPLAPLGAIRPARVEPSARGAFGGDAPAFGGRRAAGEGVEPHRRAAAVPVPMRQVLGTPRAVHDPKTSPIRCLAAATSSCAPCDHVIERQRVAWHSWAARKARCRCALPGCADGPPTDGFPTAHTVGSRRRAGGHRTARVGGTIVPVNGSGGAVGWRRAMHGGERGDGRRDGSAAARRDGARCASARDGRRARDAAAPTFVALGRAIVAVVRRL